MYMSNFTVYMNPHLGKMLESIKMDKSYTRGEGCYLYDSAGVQILDCIAAYGALPFGYHPKEIWEAIQDFQTSQEPSFIQPSLLDAAGELAARIIEIVPKPLQYVTFTNSGTEATEAAIKLCRSATGKKGILAAWNSFHGKTLGALSATGKASYQTVFGAPIEGFHFVPYGSLQALEKELADESKEYAAFILEPIQGEGGIIVPPAGYLKGVRELCSQYGVFMVVDEIQTGLGRTGSLFVCQQEQVCPDVLLIAKALGGGMIPIGACICTEDVYNEDFAMKHSSTFAANSLACRVGIKVLDMLAADDGALIRQVRQTGKFLKNKLVELQRLYPDLIRSIRGEGLMLGIEFNMDRKRFPGSLLGIIAEQQLLTPVISSYLLNCEKLRVAPTLNGNDVIRIEPPLIITQEQCERAVDSIRNMLEVLQTGNTAQFLSFLLDSQQDKEYVLPFMEPEEEAKPSGSIQEGRFAFLIHPIDLKNYCEFDRSLSVLNEEELSELALRWNDMVDPMVIARTHFISKAGAEVYGEFIAVPRTAQEMMTLPKKQILAELREAIQLAAEKGAGIVGLGAYTSVISAGGLYLKDDGIPLTTGNSYTVVAAIDAVASAMERLQIQPQYAVAAVVGAAGSIGKGAAVLLSEEVSRLVLIGNPSNRGVSLQKLYAVAGEIYKHLCGLAQQERGFKTGSIGFGMHQWKSLPNWDAPIEEFIQYAKITGGLKGSPVEISVDIDEVLPHADIVISATSNIDRMITTENLKFGAIVCDMSRPANVSEEVDRLRPDVLVIDGGVIEVPGLPSLGWDFGFDKGLAYACMSETMMLALEHNYQHASLGSSGVTIASILYMRGLAQKHGFRLASFRSFDRPLSEEKWESVIRCRDRAMVSGL